jgi:hypothetical protein
MNEIELLKFPYPYEAALAICSDIDGTSWENFLTIHKFLNSNQNTTLGKGLSLSVGDSFWMYDREENANSAFSYFKDFEGRESKNSSVIRDLISAGVIDVLHGYGNFSSVQDFSRKLAVQAIEELDKYGLKLKVWTNHGGLESVQNIGSYSAGKGDIRHEFFNWQDDALSTVYHSDLLNKYGIKFYWDNESALTSIVGQDCKCRWSDAYFKSPLNSGFKNKSKSAVKGLISFVDKQYNKITHKHFVPWQPTDDKNTLIKNEKLRDNSPIFRFKRFGNGRFDWQDDFDFLLNDNVLNRLIEKQGYLILYIHLGDRKENRDTFPLSKSAIVRFRHLAQLFYTGKLWIGTTSQLLTYNFVYHNIDWQHTKTNNKYVITINGVGKYNSFFNPSINDFSGISFKILGDRDVEIFFNNKKIDIRIIKKSKFQIVMIPITPIEWPL